ncbi:MAG: hypothetical protein ACREJW_01645, partial [Candidatus Methylomirabilales bacterium]
QRQVEEGLVERKLLKGHLDSSREGRSHRHRSGRRVGRVRCRGRSRMWVRRLRVVRLRLRCQYLVVRVTYRRPFRGCSRCRGLRSRGLILLHRPGQRRRVGIISEHSLALIRRSLEIGYRS